MDGAYLHVELGGQLLADAEHQHIWKGKVHAAFRRVGGQRTRCYGGSRQGELHPAPVVKAEPRGLVHFVVQSHVPPVPYVVPFQAKVYVRRRIGGNALCRVDFPPQIRLEPEGFHPHRERECIVDLPGDVRVDRDRFKHRPVAVVASEPVVRELRPEPESCHHADAQPELFVHLFCVVHVRQYKGSVVLIRSHCGSRCDSRSAGQQEAETGHERASGDLRDTGRVERDCRRIVRPAHHSPAERVAARAEVIQRESRPEERRTGKKKKKKRNAEDTKRMSQPIPLLLSGDYVCRKLLAEKSRSHYITRKRFLLPVGDI